MNRLAMRFAYLFMLWALVPGWCMGQRLAYLTVNSRQLQQARRVEQQAINRHDSLQLAEAWFLFGETYERVGDNQRAEPYYLKALRLLEPRGDSYALVKLYVGLGELEQRQRHFNESLTYATTALQVARRMQSVRGMAIGYRMLGHIRDFMRDGDTSRASYNRVLFCYRQAERLSVQLKDTLLITEANAFLGAFFLNGEATRSIPYLKKALQLATLKDYTDWQVKLYIHLCTAYISLGQLPQAWLYLQQAEKLVVTHQINEHGIRAMLESRFFSYYRATAQWEKAIDHLGQLNELEKQQLMADRTGALTRLSVVYENEKKEALLKAQREKLVLREANLRTQQYLLITSTGLLLVAISMSLVFFRLSRKNQRISRRNEELLREQNHRVKNNMQVISSLLSLQSRQLTDGKAKKAVEESRLRIQAMAIIHRKLYDGDHLAAINVDEFIRELTSSVLNVFGYATARVEFDIDDSDLSADKAIPLGLILNELLTNTCKYAFSDNEAPFLKISYQRRMNWISLNMTDNGPGWTDTSPDAGPAGLNRTFGIQLIRAQVRQLRGAYTINAGLEDQTTGTRFTLDFTI